MSAVQAFNEVEESFFARGDAMESTPIADRPRSRGFWGRILRDQHEWPVLHADFVEAPVATSSLHDDEYLEWILGYELPEYASYELVCAGPTL